MKILLTNDDGFVAEGIRALASELSACGLLEGVIAPSRERSGAGHSIEVGAPISLAEVETGIYPDGVRALSCGGTPVDCVNVGLDMAFSGADFVVSGVNKGPNMGNDVLYSGTVNAALEGVIQGRQAIAVSLVCGPREREYHFGTAVRAAMAVIRGLDNRPLPRGAMLNVNVPNLPPGEIKGFASSRLGVRRYLDKFTEVRDPAGRTYYWLGGRVEEERERGTDTGDAAAGYVTVTPLMLDITDRSLLDKMVARGDAGEFGELYDTEIL